jgi:hypothetical protein
MDLTRRGFLATAVATSAATLVPLDLLARAAAASAAAGARFFTPHQHATCAAICARIVPTDADPGATEARAVDFIDLFLAAFELPPDVADNPPIYMHGRYSGRNAYPDFKTGKPSASFPPSDFIDPGTRRRHFLPLSRLQELSWRAELYGVRVITDDPSLPRAYRDAVKSGLIPAPTPLRDTYRAGILAFDKYSQELFGVPFAAASPTEQDVMLTAAGNPLLSNLVPPPVGAPADAKTLFSVVVLHTFQGCYCLPEYGGNGGRPDAPPMWRWIAWEGDTMPLGNSVYDENLTDSDIAAMPGYQGSNTGFGDPAVFQPRGGYRELRQVSTNEGAAPSLSAEDIAPIMEALRRAGVIGRRGSA